MWELTKIVIPKVKVDWKQLAYCMRYSPEKVKEFERDGMNLHERCEILFANWLTTSHGPKPKTYQTLLNHIKKIDSLTDASEAIEWELTEGIDKHVNSMITCNSIEVRVVLGNSKNFAITIVALNIFQ